MARFVGGHRSDDHFVGADNVADRFLFDPAEHLFYRDSRFFERRDDRQRKLFWSRGNGWVFAGLARIIPLLPEASADRKRMVAGQSLIRRRCKSLCRCAILRSTGGARPGPTERDWRGTGSTLNGEAIGRALN